MGYATINPFTNEVTKRFADATDEDIDRAIGQADRTFQSWKKESFTTRAQVMAKAAQILRARKRDYAKLLTLEMGKLIAEAEAEVELSAQILDYYAKNAEKLLAPERLPVADNPTSTFTLVHEPLGVLLAIEPWNFPYYQIARIIAPQLSAGNVMLLKHASNVPQSAAAFEALMIEAGLPVGGFKNLYARHEQIERILNDPRVHGVAFTGSEDSGAVIAVQAAKALKKSTLELGGADAFVVLADADMEKTVKWAVFGRHWNGGQVCVSSKRIIVVDQVYDDFMARYTKGVAALRAGDPMDPATTLAPLSSIEAAEQVRCKIRAAMENGGKSVEVGPKVPAQGAFVQPTILTDITPDNPAYRWEFFGPVSMIFRAKDEADAIRIANDSPFGLGGSVFTSDSDHGAEVAGQISAGMVFVNHPTMVKADIPFGGVRRSGYGRELTNLGIMEFVNHKVVGVVDIDSAF